MNEPRERQSDVIASSPESQGRRLLRDDRGVVMVVGVFFTFLWIGMIWFVFGVGNAIAYRENMQNAADASAFAAAVYNARGMNLIAMINNLMGITLLSLLAAKLLQVANMFADGAICHASEVKTIAVCVVTVGTGCGAAVKGTVETCTKQCKNVNDWKTRMSTLDKVVHGSLQAMHTAETLVAKGWPFLAAGKAQLAGTAPDFYAYGVVGTTSLSYSMMPNLIDPNKPTSGASGLCASFTGSGTVSDGLCPTGELGKPGPRCGLPVSSDHYSSLCQVALDSMFTAGNLSIPGPLSKVIGYGTAATYDIAGQWFCDDVGFTNGVVAAANAVFTTAGTVALSTAAFTECELGDGIVSAIKAICTGGGISKGQLSLIPQTGPDIEATCPAWSPMAIYAPAKMGLDYYGVWATASGSKFAKSGTAKDFATNAVQIAGLEAKGGQPVVADPPSDAQTAVARAEFYYDPIGKPGAVSGTDTVKVETTIATPFYAAKNVMWNMRWRARLRRYHFMPTAAALITAGQYDLLVGADADLVKVLAENGTLPSVVPPKVQNQNNNPPWGMFH